MNIIQTLEQGEEAIVDLLGFNLRLIPGEEVVAVLRSESLWKILMKPLDDDED